MADVAKRCHNRGGDHLCPVHQEILESHWRTQSAGVADIVPAPCESLHVLSPGEDLAAKHGEIEQWDGSGDKGHKCAQSRALHAESQSPDGHFVAEDGEGACGENEEEVENHVEAAHQHGDGAGATHVATHLEHGGGEVLYQMDRDGEGED